jgi:serine/threonine-protein kinase
MSPEQAMGEREITARSDVYALGCVLYEMLTGEPPFTGTTAQAIVARVVTETPRPMIAQRHTIPPHVEAAVFTALEKLPADRFSSAADFGEALTSTGYTRPMTAYAVAASPAVGRWRRIAYSASAVAAVCAAAALWGWLRPEPPQPVSRYGLGFPEGQVPTGMMALSPDGARLVYEGPGDDGGTQLWMKERSQGTATPLAGTTGATVPMFSPDGQWIMFGQDDKLRKMPVVGGAAITLADSILIATAAWLGDHTVVYPRGDFALGRVSDAGGAPTVAWRPAEPQRAAVFPAPLPGSRGVLFSLCSNLCAQSDLWVLDLKSGDARMLVPGARQGWYLPTGHLAYVRTDASVLAAPFDLKRLELRGTAVPILDNLTFLFAGLFPNITFSASGTMVMEIGGGVVGTPLYEMTWIDRTGRRTALDSSWTFRHSLSNGNVGWSLSPDGRRLAIGLNTNSGDDIWIKELPTGPLSRLTFDSTSEERPRWTPDGKSVTYIVDGFGSLRQRPADGTGKEQVLVETPATPNLLEGSWSRNGEWLLLRVGGSGPTKLRNILTFRPGVDSTPRELLASSQADESSPALSPDGRWLAYASDETGRSEVYIRPFPGVDEGKWQVSTNGGQAPLWAHSGRELFFVDAARNMMVVPVPAAGPSQMGARVRLFALGDDVLLTPAEWYTPFDVSPDDRRFLMSRLVSAPATRARSFQLVENWVAEVKAKVGTN